MRRLILVLALFGPISARGAIYITRHAEKAAGKGRADPPLTPAGRNRARALARLMRSVNLSTVYVTQFRRTHETAAPVARAQKLKPVQVKAEETQALAEALRAGGAASESLVVAHSDTIPDLLKSLGVVGPAEIGDYDYDNLFVIDLASAGARLHWLHYGR